MMRRLTAIAMLLSCAGLGVFLILSALRENIVFFLVPSDIAALEVDDSSAGNNGAKKNDNRNESSDISDERRDERIVGRRIRLGGLVVEGSLAHDETSGEISFVLTDGQARVAVNYRGILPDLFREGQGVVAIGEVTSRSSDTSMRATFRAERVLAKHDEYYMPRGLEKSLKKRDLWREEP